MYFVEQSLTNCGISHAVFVQTVGRSSEQARLIKRNEAVIQHLVGQLNDAKTLRQRVESGLGDSMDKLSALLDSSDAVAHGAEIVRPLPPFPASRSPATTPFRPVAALWS